MKWILATVLAACWLVASSAGAADEEFKPPPGFVKKTRGKYQLYCKREAAMGTRVKTESCYTEDQVREYLLALQQTKQDADRIRNTCGNVCVCGNPESCSKRGPN